MLDRLADDLWTVNRTFNALGFLPAATRMTVVRLRDGGLLLHSPVRLDADLRRELDSLGPVRHVVAPNRLHHLFCGDYRAAYPDARLHGAPGVAQKRPDLGPVDELGDTAPEAWAAEVDQTVVAGLPTLNEVAFLHRPSRTVILTDLAMNGGPANPPPHRLWLRLNGADGRLATARLVRLMCRDRAAARRSLDRVLGWDFDRVSVTHGEVVGRGGKERLGEAFGAWA